MALVLNQQGKRRVLAITRRCAIQARNIMKIHKYMEAILLAALGALYTVGLTLDSLPEAKATLREKVD